MIPSHSPTEPLSDLLLPVVELDVNLNAGFIEGKGLGYKVLYGTPEIEIVEDFMINTTQGPNTQTFYAINKLQNRLL